MTQTINSFGVITEALTAAGLSGQLLKKKMVLLHSVTSLAFPVSPMRIFPFKRRLKNVCCQH